MNHHYPISAQRYALDIVQGNSLGLRARKGNPKELNDYYIYNSIVYSPCSGIVITAIDQYKDLVPGQMDPEHPAGNYHPPCHCNEWGQMRLFCWQHLMQGSFFVKEGDSIQKGQPLAKVGNSGNTSEPHLHIHTILDHTGDFLFTQQWCANDISRPISHPK